MNDTLKPKIKYCCKFLTQYEINEFKNMLVFILLISKSLVLLSFAVMFSSRFGGSKYSEGRMIFTIVNIDRH